MQAVRVKEGVVKKDFQGVHYALPIATSDDVVLDTMHNPDTEFDKFEMMYASRADACFTYNQATVGCIKTQSPLDSIRPSGYKPL